MSVGVKITVLVGGIGGARFLLGVQRLLGLGQFSGQLPGPATEGEHQLTAVVNVGDDAWMFGVRICPDLDTCMYTLGGGIDPDRGWGHRDETWHAKEELAAYGVQPDWFGLGDRDLATHLVRSQMLRAGYPLSAVTEALCARWTPGATLLPASDDRCETHVVVTDPETGDHKAIHFQEWWVRYRAKIPTHSFAFVGSEKATAGPGVIDAIAGADAHVFKNVREAAHMEMQLFISDRADITGFTFENQRSLVLSGGAEVAVEAVFGNVEFAADEPLRVRWLPIEDFLEWLAPDELLGGLSAPEFFWGVDRLRVQPLIGGIAPKICLGFELGRGPE